MKILTTVTIILLSLTAFSQAKLQIIHNSPDPLLQVVDIYVNGVFVVNVLDNFSFRSATSRFDTQTDSATVLSFNWPGSNGPNDSVISLVNLGILTKQQAYVTFFEGVYDTAAIVNPDGIRTGFSLHSLGGIHQYGTGGKVDLLFHHGTPDAPTIDIAMDGGQTLADNLSYTHFGPYVSIDADYYEINVTNASGTTLLKKLQMPLATYADQSGVVFTSGLYNDFKLYLVLGNGIVSPLAPIVGIEEQNLFHNVRLYPNPVQDELYISFTLEKTSDVNISVYNVAGQMVKSLPSFTFTPGDNLITVPATGLKPGSYWVQIRSGEATLSKPLLVE